jgi:hypothetical protein
LTVKELMDNVEIIGGTNAAKTTLLNYLTASFLEQDQAARDAEVAAGLPPREPVKVVRIDGRKIGNTEAAVNLAAAMGVRPEAATSHVLRPQADGQFEGIHYTIDLFDTTKVSIAEAIERGINSIILGVESNDADTRRMIKQYGTEGAAIAFERFEHPSIEAIVACTHEALERGKWADKETGNIGAFTETQFTSLVKSVSGPLFNTRLGYTLKPDAIIHSPGIFSPELGRLNEMGANIGVGALYQQIFSVLRAENGGEIKHLRVLMITDEGLKLFELEETASFTSFVRTEGMGTIVATQDGTRIHTIAENNIHTSVHLLCESSQYERAAARLHITPEEAEFLDSVALNDINGVEGPSKGGGLIKAGGMSQPAILQTFNPESLPTGEGTVNYDLSHLVDKGIHEKLYSGAALKAAEKFLQKELSGVKLDAWAQMNAYLFIHGAPLMGLKPHPEEGTTEEGALHTMLHTMSQSEDPLVVDKLNAAIDTAVTEAGVARRLTHEQQAYIVEHMRSQVRDAVPEKNIPYIPTKVRPELAHPVGQFSPLLDLLSGEIVAPALKGKDIGPYEEIMGEILGVTARNQLDDLAELEREAVYSVAETVTYMAEHDQQIEDKQDIEMHENVILRLSALLGDKSQKSAEEIHQRVQERIGAAHARDMSEQEKDALNSIVHKATALLPSNPERVVSYKGLRATLNKAIKAADATDAVNVEMYERAYGFKITGNTAKEQLACVEAELSRRLTESGQNESEMRTNSLYAYRLNGEGFALDVIGAKLLGLSNEQGDIFDRQKYMQKRGEQTFLKILQNNDAKAEDAYLSAFREGVAGNRSDFQMHEFTRGRLLIRGIDKVLVPLMNKAREAAPKPSNQG